jgi:hypothetical protein
MSLTILLKIPMCFMMISCEIVKYKLTFACKNIFLTMLEKAVSVILGDKILF